MHFSDSLLFMETHPGITAFPTYCLAFWPGIITLGFVFKLLTTHNTSLRIQSGSAYLIPQHQHTYTRASTFSHANAFHGY
ncbi:hypothetical protein GQ43DRAFT_199569 [Delitschia confertaspora ATCC 74209]|uniref:Uncharacterized protein n=1 Tax=Delitschia confertaspora ATCC 74209 TaxID=1513339 RepID=A0A9P4JJE8_9PLEO|nr:hypothetical protein GQ43DRAFT_199569 [Delitschia confertaspora ATCC 74209]